MTSNISSKNFPIEQREFAVEKLKSGHIGRFFAMASPCEVIIDSSNKSLCTELTEAVANEAWRIEQTYSRYRKDNQIYQINNNNGIGVSVDEELARLLNFAQSCYQLSDGLFDITSGVLRRVWRFDGSDNVPSRKQVKALFPLIGWDKVTWSSPTLKLLAGMEIDLGGFGKEYAVDRAGKIAAEITDHAFLINFGGDLFANKPPSYQPSWDVGVESIGGGVDAVIKLQQGALATSGDARRYLTKKGKRYSHVLNPRTGWSVSNAPNSVTVAAPRCIDAGFLSTLAMLKGKNAEDFLSAQDVVYQIQR